MLIRNKALLPVVPLAVASALLAGCNDDSSPENPASRSYPIVDTAQGTCYDTSALIDCPAAGNAFYGQDAQTTGNTPSYTDNGDATITDKVTGLVWTQGLSKASMPWSEAAGYC
mgnify:FL=1